MQELKNELAIFTLFLTNIMKKTQINETIGNKTFSKSIDF